ncbi:MAG: non-hydrolyzing UDP-N-acetylglucosamine 2-epimerase [Hyphomicrobium sp.]
MTIAIHDNSVIASSRAAGQRIMVVFGTRPEAIKMMPVVLELRKRPGFHPVVVSTGQHRTMLDQVFSLFGESPDIDLDIMTPGQTLSDITGRVLQEMSKVYAGQRVDRVLVHGDTTTAMAAALSAFYARVPIGHVEAGLRSYDLSRPWPEEFNRVAIDCIADMMFAPTKLSAGNLRNEYNRQGEILVTGNTGIDALMFVSGRLDRDVGLVKKCERKFKFLNPERRLVLVTGHRRESFGDGFQQICDGLLSIAGRGDVEVVYPVHLNPNVRSVVQKRLSGHDAIHLIEPVEYLDMVYLMKRAHILLTDSGGIQEEGPALGKPVLVMRDVTERPEAVSLGAVELVGCDPKRIRSAIDRLLDDRNEYHRRAKPCFPYGDGTAARRIVDAISEKIAV